MIAKPNLLRRIFTGLLSATLLAAVWGWHQDRQELQHLQDYGKNDLMVLAYLQHTIAQGLDYRLAQAFASASVSKRQKHLLDAREHCIRMFGAFNTHYLAASNQFPEYMMFWSNAYKYLGYAASSESTELLPLQLENLQRIRNHAATLHTYYQSALKLIKESDPMGLRNHAKLLELSQELNRKMHESPNVGEGDKAFNDWSYLQNPYPVEEPGKEKEPVVPQITPKEALGKLKPGLKAAGEPSLQTRNRDLVFAIPVSGIERVTHVYIDAVTGNEAGIEYDWNHNDQR